MTEYQLKILWGVSPGPYEYWIYPDFKYADTDITGISIQYPPGEPREGNPYLWI